MKKERQEKIEKNDFHSNAYAFVFPLRSILFYGDNELIPLNVNFNEYK